MFNRTVDLFKLIKDELWSELVTLIQIYEIYGSAWDKVEPDAKEL
jgi:hypothetical protein